MRVSVDLHSHSGASGGVGDISLEVVAATMARKGIDVFGCGDAFHDGWLAHLDQALVPAEEGLYRLAEGDGQARFLIQSEIILTGPVGSGRKGVHTVVLLPDLAAARAAARLLDRWAVKRGIGRPFVPCDDRDQVAARCHALADVAPGVELIPAHVLTPQGIYGSDRPVDRLADFFGDAAGLIRAVETGLSADPLVLALIPELDGRTLLSNSDCHSGALHRVGREYTVLDAAALDYPSILTAIRERRIVQTAEFTPEEGRYFLTGHRAGKRGHKDGQYCFFSPDTVPAGDVCPVCGKRLTVGVLQRALYLSGAQGEPRTLDRVRPRQPFVRMIPLVEVIAAGLGIRNPASKKVVATYDTLVRLAGGETAFWAMTDSNAEAVLANLDQPPVAEAVRQVRAGDYAFQPLGYDGVYGTLDLGERNGWFGHATVVGADPGRLMPPGDD
ncbi:MAG: endonuclease Q family protein [Planctomycetota bacterium]